MTLKLRFLAMIGIFPLLAACGILPEKEIVTKTVIPFETDKVWAVLIDNQKYAEWNPFIVKSSGDPIVGKQITNTIRPEPGSDSEFSPVILVTDRNKEFRWKGSSGIPGLFDGEHYFLLEAQGGNTKLTHGEKFTGFGLWFIDVSKFETNFKDMNNALRLRIEELESSS